MENTISELKCYCCKTVYKEDDKFCGNCGYPFQATPEEQKQFSIKYSVNKFSKDDIEKKVKEARIVLFVIAGFTVVQGAIIYFKEESGLLLVVNIILAAIYAGLGFWAKKKAFAAILTGTLIYLSVMILNAFVNPLTIIQGIIFKVVFLVAFIKAAYGAYKYKI